jgi:hypothetical protein
LPLCTIPLLSVRNFSLNCFHVSNGTKAQLSINSPFWPLLLVGNFNYARVYIRALFTKSTQYASLPFVFSNGSCSRPSSRYNETKSTREIFLIVLLWRRQQSCGVPLKRNATGWSSRWNRQIHRNCSSLCVAARFFLPTFQDSSRTLVEVDVQGVTKNVGQPHGLHIHEYGDLSDTNSGNSVGGHFIGATLLFDKTIRPTHPHLALQGLDLAIMDAKRKIATLAIWVTGTSILKAECQVARR